MVWGTWNRGRMWDNRTKLLHTQGGVRRTSVWCVSKWWDTVHLHLHGIFGWDFWDKWNSLFLPVKTGQNTMLYHLSKTTQLSSVDWWDFCKWYSLSRSFRLKQKKKNYLRRHSFYSGKCSPGWTVPFDISSEKTGFSEQMVSAHGVHGILRVFLQVIQFFE